jgi:CheY-like chemotaxis protein
MKRGEQKMPKEKILLVEDNPMNRRVAEFLLKSQGYLVYEARDGQEAIELAKMHAPDLILMDLQLPGMDGFATTRLIKGDAAIKNIPIVALTAYAMRGDAERALNAGCAGYITKPIDPDQFPATVASYLKKA